MLVQSAARSGNAAPVPPAKATTWLTFTTCLVTPNTVSVTVVTFVGLSSVHAGVFSDGLPISPKNLALKLSNDSVLVTTSLSRSVLIPCVERYVVELGDERSCTLFIGFSTIQLDWFKVPILTDISFHHDSINQPF